MARVRPLQGSDCLRGRSDAALDAAILDRAPRGYAGAPCGLNRNLMVDRDLPAFLGAPCCRRDVAEHLRRERRERERQRQRKRIAEAARDRGRGVRDGACTLILAGERQRHGPEVAGAGACIVVAEKWLRTSPL